MRVKVTLPSPEGRLLRAYRLRANLTQGQLGARIGRSGALIGLLEQSQYRMNLANIHRVSDGLNLTDEERRTLIRASESTWEPRRVYVTWEPLKMTKEEADAERESDRRRVEAEEAEVQRKRREQLNQDLHGGGSRKKEN